MGNMSHRRDDIREITYYILRVDWLLSALDAHRFSYTEDGPTTKTKAAQGAVGRDGGTQLHGTWALVPGPSALWLNICASSAINRQYLQGNILDS